MVNSKRKRVVEKNNGSIYEVYGKFTKNLSGRTIDIKYSNDKIYKKEARKTYIKTKKARELVKDYVIPSSEFRKILDIIDKFTALKINKKLNKAQLDSVNTAYEMMIKKLIEEGKIKKRTN